MTDQKVDHCPICNFKATVISTVKNARPNGKLDWVNDAFMLAAKIDKTDIH